MKTANHDFEIHVSNALGRIEQKVDSLADDFGGPQGRITRIEAAQTRQWWITMAIAPVVALLHGLARKFGADI